MVLDTLRKLWYNREDYIRLAGNDILQRLKQQDAFRGLSPESVVSIDPSSKKYVVADSPAKAIITGNQQFGHMDFYCVPINHSPGPHDRYSDSQVLKRGERVLRQLKEERKLDDIAGSSFIAVEPHHGRYVVGDSREEVIKKGADTFGHDRMYVRPIDDGLIPYLSL